MPLNCLGWVVNIFNFFLLIYLAVLGVSCGMWDLLTGGFSLVPMSIGYSPVALHGLMVAVAFLVEHGL